MAINESIVNIAIKYNTEDLTLFSDKIYSIEGECIFEGPYNKLSITENNKEPTEMIDFEELIDLTLKSVDKKSIQDIKEFENVLNSVKTSKDIITDVKETLSLDEVNDYFEKIITENSSINIQNVPIVENRQCTDIKTEDIYINNNSNIKLETPNNDADIFIDLTTESADVSSKDIKLDIISISSEDDTQSIASDDYHSSDFEFITETEAQMDGYLINFSRIKSSNSRDDIYDKVKLKCISGDADNTTSQVNKEINNTIVNPAQCSRWFNKQVDIDSNSSLTSPPDESQISEAGRNSNVSNLGEGPSGLNRPIYDYSNRDYRQNHLIPEGEGYLDLFQGPYNPVLPMSDIIFLENKSIRPSPMNIQYEGIGFDKQLIWRKCQPDSSEDEYEDEAKESTKKIQFMYPDYNIKPRRKRF